MRIVQIGLAFFSVQPCCKEKDFEEQRVDSIFVDGQMYYNWTVKMKNSLRIETCLGMQLQFGNTGVFRSLDCQI